MNMSTRVSRIQDLENEWECVVIGAGPAGAMAARTAARRGLRTLIIDRKKFPRQKVCGTCVNRRALSLLEQVGLGHVVQACQSIPLDRYLLRCQGGKLSLRLPGGVAVSRATLDEALVREAVSAGAIFVDGTAGSVLPAADPRFESTNDNDQFAEPRVVRLDTTSGDDGSPDSRLVRASVVIAADGLGHRSLKGLSDFREKVAKSSRIGIGAVLEQDGDEFECGTIAMAVGRGGYVGMVRSRRDQLHVAACLETRILRDKGDPGAAIADIVRHAGFAGLGFAELNGTGPTWKGTPQLTRSTSRVASQGVFVVGDAAGYIEPFTGEGIAWALAGGVSVGACAATGVRNNRMAAEQIWSDQWRNLVFQRQVWCRRLSHLLRSPSAASVAVRAASAVPSLAQKIVASLNSTAPDLQVWPS